MKTNIYTQAGYTHFIHYKEWVPNVNTFVQSGFPTTQCALAKHIEEIKKRQTTDIEIENLLETVSE